MTPAGTIIPQIHARRTRFEHREQKASEADESQQDAGVVGVKVYTAQPGGEAQAEEPGGDDLQVLLIKVLYNAKLFLSMSIFSCDNCEMDWSIGAAHYVFETLGYATGFRLYLRARRTQGDFLLTTEARTWVVVEVAILGAALGSKMLFWLEDPARTWQHVSNLEYLLSGKTIVGGSPRRDDGGRMGRKRGWRSIAGRATSSRSPWRSGLPSAALAASFAGLPDDTYGLPSKRALPWAVDFGDGVPRHPTQLYTRRLPC